MELLNQLLAQYTELLKTQPILAGLASMWGLTVLGFFFRDIPTRIWSFIKNQSTTTLFINNTSMGTNMESFNNFLRWFEGSKWTRFSRTLSLNGGWTEYGPKGEDGTIVGMGDGKHFCVYKGRPIWITRRRLESNQSTYQINYEISITMLGRRRELVHDLIAEFRYRRKENEIGIFVFDKEWKRVGVVRKRPLNTVIVDPVIKAKLLSKIDKWQGDSQWYYDRGFAYKLTIMLHGIPGSGKTSLIKALAGHYRRDLCLLHLASMSDTMLRDALMTAPDNAMIALEDFDDVESIHTREGMSKNIYAGGLPTSAPAIAPAPGPYAYGESLHEDKPDTDNGMPNLATLTGVTMSGMLQSLDGLLSLDGKILFLTTNRPEVFDPAILRKGRINETFCIGALQSPQIHEYVQLMYPELDYDRTIQFEPIAGCDLEDHYKQTLDEPMAFVEILPKAQPKLSLIHCE